MFKQTKTGSGNLRIKNNTRTATVRKTKNGAVLSLHNAHVNPPVKTKSVDTDDLGISFKGILRRTRRWVNGSDFVVRGKVIFA